MSHANLIAAIVVIGSKAGESGGLFTRDAADLGHAHQNGDGGSQTDAVDTDDQIEPLGKIAVRTDGCDEAFEFTPEHRIEACDLGIPVACAVRIAAGRAAGLEPGDVLGDLLDQRQMLGKWR
jgi:hypothetical protein